MPKIGSFSLLLALALAAYSFIAGALALYRKDDRLGETARRAGIATFVAGAALIEENIGINVSYINSIDDVMAAALRNS